MIRYILVSIAGGILFGFLDGLINVNPLAQKLNGAYKPIARKSVNVPAGIAIDLAYGFILGAVFLLLCESLPGHYGYVKGISFGLLVWFFRVVMNAASSWMMHDIPAGYLLYKIVAGLVEMLLLGLLYGSLLKPIYYQMYLEQG